MPATPTVADAADRGASDQQVAEVYRRLKAMASRQRRRAGGATLDTTAIVHELYLKLNEGGQARFTDPVRFFAYAARAMRSILVDAARRRGCRQRIGLDGGTDAERAGGASTAAGIDQVLEIDAALDRLAQDDPRAARLVELHYFAGLSLPQIAEIFGVATRTLNRDWRFARAVLYSALR